MQDFIDIIFTKVKGLKTNILFRLLGDEVADRGACDFLILIILAKLHSEGVINEILISNHAIAFIEAYEKIFAAKQQIDCTILPRFEHVLGEHQARSFNAPRSD